MKTSYIIIMAVVIVLVIVGVIVIAANSGKSNVPNTPAGNSSDSGNVSNIKTFYISGQNFKFSMNGQDNPDIVVNKGDTVKIVFTSSGGFHDFVIDEFSARTKSLNSGQTDTIEFVANTAGTFEYYCSVSTHRQMGMHGNFIVK